MIDYRAIRDKVERVAATAGQLGVDVDGTMVFAPARLRGPLDVPHVAVTLRDCTAVEAFGWLADEAGARWGDPDLTIWWGRSEPDPRAILSGLRLCLSWLASRRRAGRRDAARAIANLTARGPRYAVGIPVRDLPVLDEGLTAIAAARAAAYLDHTGPAEAGDDLTAILGQLDLTVRDHELWRSGR